MGELLLSSRIDAVTVHRSGAIVRRVAELPATQNPPAAFRFVGLPLALDDASCRASIEGAAQSRVVDLRIGLDVVGGDAPAEPPTEEALREARTNEAVARMRLERARSFREMLAQLRIEPRERVERHAPGASPTSARLDVLAMRRDETAALDAEIAALTHALREAERVRADAEQRLALASSAREARPHELRKSAIVGIRGSLADDARLVLEYRVPGARWAPAYTLRLDRAMKRAELAMRAMVAQQTGEDWTSARLTLSTALPTTWTELPKLPSLRIGRRQPAPVARGFREPPADDDALFADYDRAFPKAPPPTRAPAPPPEPAPHAADYGPPIAAPLPPAPPPTAPPLAGPTVPTFAAPAGVVVTAPLAAKGGGPFAFLSAAAAPAAPPPQAARTRLGAITPMMELLSAPPPPEEPPQLEPSDAMLDFDALTMPGPRDCRRGKPTPTERFDGYVALLHATRVSVALDVRVLVEQAVAVAQRVDACAPPAGHRVPGTLAGYDYAYVAEARVDLASDGAFRSVPVALRVASAAPRYVAVPRVQSDVFRTVAFDVPFEGPVLEGPVDVYVEGEFLVTSRFEFAPPKGQVELGLGVEAAIKVARNTTFREETQGLLRGTNALAHTIRIEVANGLGDAIPIEIRERIPVADPGESELAVELTRVEPKSTPWEERGTPLLGGHAFRLDVPAHAKATVAIDYVVTLPTKRELVGGNRREGV